MGWLGYFKSFFISKKTKKEFFWVSALILYTHENQLLLDKGFVITNPRDNDILSYCNFSNFTVIDGKLYYLSKCKTLNQIDPSLVHLHIKMGKCPYKIREDDIGYWNIHFSSPKNKIYQTIATSLTSENIRFIDKPESNEKLNLKLPMFETKQIYGKSMDQLMFSKLDISFL